MAVTATDLGGFPLFRSLTETELARLVAGAERIEVAAGIELTRQGDFGHSLFVVLDGTADVRVEGRVVRSLCVGDVFGEIAVTASGRRTADVLSTTPMALASVFKRDVWAIEQQNPAFAEQLRALRASYGA